MHEPSTVNEIRAHFPHKARREPPDPLGESATASSRGSVPKLSEIGQLIARLRPRLEAAALRVTRDPEAAKDVVQQAALKAIRFRHQFKGASTLSTWIHRIVINEALVWRRSQGRFARALERFEGEPALHCATPEEIVAERRRLGAVANGLERLGAQDREVLVELVANSRALGEITERLGIPRTALRTRIFRARRRLEKLLETA
jgi:RNA polymerase sigma-70 factor (ECF subfamily)